VHKTTATKAKAVKASPAKPPVKAAKKPRAKSQVSAQSRALLATILKSLDDDKAEEIISIDMSGRTPMADFMVVASGRSNRHVAAIAEHLAETLRVDGLKCRVEGLQQGDWVLIDAVDVIVHVFRPEVRAFYNLEQMWSGAESAAAGG
jgi:ribosome-associated protein